MLAALVLSVLTISPAQAGDLQIKNARLTHGLLGQTRKDAKLLPGEIAVLSYDVVGVKVNPDGSVDYSTGFRLISKATGKPVLTRDPEDKKAVNNLGGNVLPSFTFTFFGLDTKPGEYTIELTVENNKRKVSFSQDVEVVAPKLGFVRARLTSAAFEPIPPIAVPGQAFLLQFSLVGFKTDKDGAGDLTVEVEMQDETGKPTVETPAKVRFKPTVKPDAVIVEFKPLPLQLNRPGKFKVVLRATDNQTKATASQELDIEVLSR